MLPSIDHLIDSLSIGRFIRARYSRCICGCERMKESMTSRHRSALRICRSPLRRTMARSDLGGTSRKGGWMKRCWILPIIFGAWSYYGTTVRCLSASHTFGTVERRKIWLRPRQRRVWVIHLSGFRLKHSPSKGSPCSAQLSASLPACQTQKRVQRAYREGRGLCSVFLLFSAG